jgi:3-oxosteroid 1-dehydrogenase
VTAEKRVTQDRVEECDVVVVGSGAAALTAALTVSIAGLDTVVIEKTGQLGGTSAISAAGIWVPANHHARAAGIDDSPEEALQYIRTRAPPGWQNTEGALWRRFVGEAPKMLLAVEQHTPLRFKLTPQPDPYPDVPGARQRGRMLSPRPLRRSVAGAFAGRLRPPMLPHIFTYQELLKEDPYHRPVIASLKLIHRVVWRWLTGSRGMGTALIAGLLKGCIDHRCRIETDKRATELILDSNGDVRGVVAQQNGTDRRIAARRGVVLATGGFEWNSELVAKYFPGPVDFVTSPRSNEGDGHRMAEAAGAELVHMDQANVSPAIPITYDGALQGLSIAFQHEPNAIVVDAAGRRFVDEFRFNIGEVMDERDPTTGRPIHLPAWVISDSRFLRRSPIVRRYAGRDERWLIRSNSLRDLAARTNLPAEQLVETVARFNSFCATGIDADFHRGESEPGRRRAVAGPKLVPIAHPPFIAMPFNRSFVSTKGGPRTNEYGQVLRPGGKVIKGLYCAGVAMANPIGTWAVGAGTTLGPNMTWGYICGQAIVNRDPK